MRLRSSTVLAAVVCVGSVGLAWADPWADRSANAPMVSTRSAARRVFPELADRELERATIELQGPEGPPVRIVPSPEGEHQVSHGDRLLGAADPDALDGMWASLRMATTLRAVAKGTDVGAGQQGVIRITFSDQTLSLALGHEAPAGNGLYGIMEHEGKDAWVIENELASLIAQAPETWLARRLLLIEADDVVSLAWGQQLGLARGRDGRWRVETGSEPALLSSEAVDLRLERLFSSRLDPLIERDATQSVRPWLAVTARDGRVHTLAVGGACPGDPDRRLVDRGPGLLGCVVAESIDPWKVDDPDTGLLESRLIPYTYGEVLSIEMARPHERRLKRRVGGWALADAAGEHEVSESEVYRWYSALTAQEVEAMESDEEDRFEPDVVLVIGTDSGQRLTVRCQGAQTCTRDDGPPRRVVGEERVELEFSAERFAERNMLSIAPGDVRALEISSSGDTTTVRQSVHLDLGAWRLDAPSHPDGDAALDDVRLEALLAALSALRAAAWVETAGEPRRVLAIDLVPRDGREPRIEVQLYADCVVGVAGRRAKVEDDVCATLAGDLLYDDPVRGWLRTARSVQIEQGGREVLLRREGEVWAGEDADQLEASIADWTAWRSEGLRAGSPSGTVEQTWTVRRDDGPTVTLEIGPEFVHVSGADWHYAGPSR